MARPRVSPFQRRARSSLSLPPLQPTPAWDCESWTARDKVRRQEAGERAAVLLEACHLMLGAAQISGEDDTGRLEEVLLAALGRERVERIGMGLPWRLGCRIDIESRACRSR